MELKTKTKTQAKLARKFSELADLVEETDLKSLSRVFNIDLVGDLEKLIKHIKECAEL